MVTFNDTYCIWSFVALNSILLVTEYMITFKNSVPHLLILVYFCDKPLEVFLLQFSYFFLIFYRIWSVFWLLNSSIYMNKHGINNGDGGWQHVCLHVLEIICQCTYLYLVSGGDLYSERGFMSQSLKCSLAVPMS